MIAQIKGWLEASHWLMVIDNADDADILVDPPDPSLQTARKSTDALISYIPTATNGKVIFISRNKQAALRLTRNGKILHIPKMSTEEAIKLLIESSIATRTVILQTKLHLPQNYWCCSTICPLQLYKLLRISGKIQARSSRTWICTVKVKTLRPSC